MSSNFFAVTTEPTIEAFSDYFDVTKRGIPTHNPELNRLLLPSISYTAKERITYSQDFACRETTLTYGRALEFAEAKYEYAWVASKSTVVGKVAKNSIESIRKQLTSLAKAILHTQGIEYIKGAKIHMVETQRKEVIFVFGPLRREVIPTQWATLNTIQAFTKTLANLVEDYYEQYTSLKMYSRSLKKKNLSEGEQKVYLREIYNSKLHFQRLLVSMKNAKALKKQKASISKRLHNLSPVYDIWSSRMNNATVYLTKKKLPDFPSLNTGLNFGVSGNGVLGFLSNHQIRV
jgi:hypothetical protein